MNEPVSSRVKGFAKCWFSKRFVLALPWESAGGRESEEKGLNGLFARALSRSRIAGLAVAVTTATRGLSKAVGGGRHRQSDLSRLLISEKTEYESRAIVYYRGGNGWDYSCCVKLNRAAAARRGTVPACRYGLGEALCSVHKTQTGVPLSLSLFTSSIQTSMHFHGETVSLVYLEYGGVSHSMLTKLYNILVCFSNVHSINSTP